MKCFNGVFISTSRLFDTLKQHSNWLLCSSGMQIGSTVMSNLHPYKELSNNEEKLCEVHAATDEKDNEKSTCRGTILMPEQKPGLTVL